MDPAKLDLLQRLLAQLDKYAATVTRKVLEEDLDAWLMVSRAMELAAQCCIDMATFPHRKNKSHFLKI